MSILLLMAALAAPQPSELHSYRDWTVGCDNGRACHATSLLPEDAEWDDALFLRVERDGAADAPVRLTLMGGDGKAAALTADGKKLRLRAASGDDDQAVDPADVAAAVAAMRSAASLGVVDAGGKRIGAVSLAGASAAMLFIDDVQKRIGTVTALARPGPRPASNVPAPPPLPVVRSAAVAGATGPKVDDARIAALRKESECIPEDKDWPGYDAEQASIDADHTLILLGCGAGAYNFSAIPYIAVRAGKGVRIAIAQFDRKPTSDESDRPMLVNADWVPKEGLLSAFAKARGLGDCGVGADYAWDGTRFRLVEQIEMGECRGSTDYITTWRATVVR